MITLDTKKITKELGIEEEKLKRMSLNSIIRLDEKIKRQEKKRAEKECLENPLYKEMVRNFYNKYDIARLLFSENEIMKACAKFMTLSDLSEEYIDRRCVDSLSYRPSILKEKKVCKMKKLHGPGSRSGATENIMCSIFYVPNKYQYINGGSDTLEYLLEKRYGYHFDVYNIQNEKEDIYLKIGDRTLYIPFHALVDGNKEAIEQRNIDYFKKYNGTDVSSFVYSKEVQDVLDKLCER